MVMNTMFRKSPEKLAGYAEVFNPLRVPPWSPDRFATLDHVLIRRAWKNAVHDVETMPHQEYDSDHLCMKTLARFKLGARKIKKTLWNLGKKKNVLGLKCQCGFGSGLYGPPHQLRVLFCEYSKCGDFLDRVSLDADLISNFELKVLVVKHK